VFGKAKLFAKSEQLLGRVHLRDSSDEQFSFVWSFVEAQENRPAFTRETTLGLQLTTSCNVSMKNWSRFACVGVAGVNANTFSRNREVRDRSTCNVRSRSCGMIQGVFRTCSDVEAIAEEK
jgi:hypothetical protein